jgi:hypothetical protein
MLLVFFQNYVTLMSDGPWYESPEAYVADMEAGGAGVGARRQLQLVRPWLVAIFGSQHSKSFRSDCDYCMTAAWEQVLPNLLPTGNGTATAAGVSWMGQSFMDIQIKGPSGKDCCGQPDVVVQCPIGSSIVSGSIHGTCCSKECNAETLGRGERSCRCGSCDTGDDEQWSSGLICRHRNSYWDAGGVPAGVDASVPECTGAECVHDGSKCSDNGNDCCASSSWDEPQTCKDGYIPTPTTVANCVSTWGSCTTHQGGIGCYACYPPGAATAPARGYCDGGRFNLDVYKQVRPRAAMLAHRAPAASVRRLNTRAR